MGREGSASVLRDSWYPPQSEARIQAFIAFTIAARFPNGFTVKQLQESFGMSRATAYRFRGAWLAVHPEVAS